MSLFGNLAASAINPGKAFISALEGTLAAAPPFVAKFNPNEYAVPYTSRWEGKKTEIPQYQGAGADNFTVTLFFDGYEAKQDVRLGIDGIQRLLLLTTPSVPQGSRNRPPVCLFVWGTFKFQGVIESIKVKYTLFLGDGTPVRAKADLTMRSVLEVKERLILTGVKDSRKFRTVKAGDRLDRIAQEELGNPHLWHLIAQMNSIEDPLLFPADADINRTLTIPHLET